MVDRNVLAAFSAANSRPQSDPNVTAGEFRQSASGHLRAMTNSQIGVYFFVLPLTILDGWLKDN